MKILIIGGTIFLGRYLTTEALKSGHQVTLFNRGKHNPDLFVNQVKTVIGDRENPADLEKLVTENFDVVIDTCAYLPATIEKSLRILKECCKQYVFISTISVYQDEKQSNISEDYPLATLSDSVDSSKITNETYGALKALCEHSLSKIFGSDSLTIRPGYIVGPYDQFDRFVCWIAEGFKQRSMLCPGDGYDSIQFIDVRDLAKWTIQQIENKTRGIFNVTGESIKITEFVKECTTVAGNAYPVKLVPSDIIDKDNFWSAFPMYMHNKDEYLGYCQTNITKAKQNGLTFRPYRETINDIYNWHQSRGSDYKLREGISDEQYLMITTELNKTKKG